MVFEYASVGLSKPNLFFDSTQRINLNGRGSACEQMILVDKDTNNAILLATKETLEGHIGSAVWEFVLSA